MIRNFEYLIVFTSAPSVLLEQNDRYRIQAWKVNEIKAYKNIKNFENILETCKKLRENIRKIPCKSFRKISKTGKKFWRNYDTFKI